jgi:hypothetical protein
MPQGRKKGARKMKMNKLMIAALVLLPSAVTTQAALVKPTGLTVVKNWNFDGDGVTGGTVDSGTSGTDWVNNSADSVLAQFNGGTYGVAFTNASKDSNLFVNTAAGTLTYQSPVLNQESRFRLNFDEAKTAGWLDMRAKAEALSGTIYTARTRFLSSSGGVLAELNLRQNSEIRFTIGAVNYAFTNEAVNSFNGYQIAWENQKISVYFDDEAHSGVNAWAYTGLSITGDVASVQWTITSSGATGKGTIDSLNIEVIPEPATIGMLGLGTLSVLLIRRLTL